MSGFEAFLACSHISSPREGFTIALQAVPHEATSHDSTGEIKKLKRKLKKLKIDTPAHREHQLEQDDFSSELILLQTASLVGRVPGLEALHSSSQLVHLLSVLPRVAIVEYFHHYLSLFKPSYSLAETLLTAALLHHAGQ